MDLIRAYPKFRSLSERQVRAALATESLKNPIIKELARLADAYKNNFKEQCKKSAHEAECFLHALTKCPIEAVALEMAAIICDDDAEETVERRISSDVLTLTGYTLFGNQWQTPLAAALEVSDRTVRRWVVDGAPIKIVPELREILSSHLAIGKQALVLLEAIPSS